MDSFRSVNHCGVIPCGLEEKYRGSQVIEVVNRSRAVPMKSAERSFVEANRSTPFLAFILRSKRLQQPKSTRRLGADRDPTDSLMPESGSIDPHAGFSLPFNRPAAGQFWQAVA
jgi:hypothetical protein